MGEGILLTFSKIIKVLISICLFIKICIHFIENLFYLYIFHLSVYEITVSLKEQKR